MYLHELIHELEIIPAWECFLAGVMVGMAVTLWILAHTGGGGHEGGADARLAHCAAAASHAIKRLHEAFADIWDCEIDHRKYQDTVGEILKQAVEIIDSELA